jgi:hypothetical protein
MILVSCPCDARVENDRHLTTRRRHSTRHIVQKLILRALQRMTRHILNDVHITRTQKRRTLRLQNLLQNNGKAIKIIKALPVRCTCGINIDQSTQHTYISEQQKCTKEFPHGCTKQLDLENARIWLTIIHYIL